MVLAANDRFAVGEQGDFPRGRETEVILVTESRGHTVTASQSLHKFLIEYLSFPAFRAGNEPSPTKRSLVRAVTFVSFDDEKLAGSA